MFPFVNRVYDAFLAWYFERMQWRYTRLNHNLLALEARIEKRRQIAWRWEPDPAFKRRVGHMSAEEFRKMKDAYPDFITRLGNALRHTYQGVDPAKVYISDLPRTVHDFLGKQMNDLAADVIAFKQRTPKLYDDLSYLYTQAPALPNAHNTLVPGSDKTFAEMGLPIDSTLVVEPTPSPERKQELSIFEQNDIVDRMLHELLRHRSDDPNEIRVVYIDPVPVPESELNDHANVEGKQ